MAPIVSCCAIQPVKSAHVQSCAILIALSLLLSYYYYPTCAFSTKPLHQASAIPSSLPLPPQDVPLATTAAQDLISKRPLASWLKQNNATIQSSIGSDENGLRGLVLDAHDHHQQQEEDQIICQIPRNCIIVANDNNSQLQLEFNEQRGNSKSQSSIDALASTLLTEIQRGSKSHYFPYITNMPGHDDISLKSIGGTWTRDQMTKYLAHEPTMRYFERLGSEREEFILESISNDLNLIGDAVKASRHRVLAGWAYDLVSSRALQGPFGKQGRVRLAILSTMASFALAAVAPLVLVFLSANGSIDELTLPELMVAIIPFVISSSHLISTLLQSKQEPELAMLPWIDIANHKSGSKLSLEYGLFRDEIILKKGDEVATESSFVNFDYGGASQGAGNDKLLGIYGFVEEDNPNDTMDVQIGNSEDEQIFITIGRNGTLKTQLSSSSGEEMKDALRKVTQNIHSLRRKFRYLDQMHDSAVISDLVERQRCRLASQWRAEKIRLIDEFLGINSPPILPPSTGGETTSPLFAVESEVS